LRAEPWGLCVAPRSGAAGIPGPHPHGTEREPDIDVNTVDVRGRQALGRGRRAYSPASLGGGAGEAGARGAEGPPNKPKDPRRATRLNNGAHKT